MDKYIERLIKCGYGRDRAVKTCEEIERNLGLFNLELFISAVERKKHNVAAV